MKFINNKGETIELDGKLTIRDLVEMKIDFVIHPVESPILNDWYRAVDDSLNSENNLSS
jgi:hypothetical protein